MVKHWKKQAVSSVLIPGNELYTALERGVIDATEWIGPYHDYKIGFHQIADYYYAPGWHESGTTLEFFMNKELFDSLPKDLQIIIETAALRINHWMLSEFEAKNAIYLEKLVVEEEVDVRFYPEEVIEQLRYYTEETITEITDTDPISKQVYEAYQDFRKLTYDWADLTEKAYFDLLAKNPNQKGVN